MEVFLLPQPQKQCLTRLVVKKPVEHIVVVILYWNWLAKIKFFFYFYQFYYAGNIINITFTVPGVLIGTFFNAYFEAFK